MSRTKSDPRKAVGLVRVSTGKQALSPDAQRAAINAWADRAGVVVVAWYEEQESGATAAEDRAALQAAVDALRTNRAGRLVVATLDRLARSLATYGWLEEVALPAVGAELVAADAEHDDPMMRALRMVFAREERKKIARRTAAALQAKRARGEKTGGTVPYGYTLAADGVHLEPVPAEQSIVARARELRAQRLGAQRIAKALTADGFAARNGRPFTPTQVARMF